jgi:hypothetical protein
MKKLMLAALALSLAGTAALAAPQTDSACGQLEHQRFSDPIRHRAQVLYYVVTAEDVRVPLIPRNLADDSLLSPGNDGLGVCAYGERTDDGLLTDEVDQQPQLHHHSGATVSN